MDDNAILEALAVQLDRAPADPANKAPYPIGLSLDLALQTAPLADILAAYDLTPEKARRIFANPAFRLEYDGHREALKQEGYSFRRKAGSQAERYLGLLWNMAHSENVPAAVRANIVTQTVKWAGLEVPAPAPLSQTSMVTPEMLQQLASMPDNELEIRVMSLVSRKKPQAPADAGAREARLIASDE